MMNRKPIPIRECSDFECRYRAMWYRGTPQIEALAELDRRGLKLTATQRAVADIGADGKPLRALIIMGIVISFALTGCVVESRHGHDDVQPARIELR
jgi:hypothetical protein